MFVDSVDKFRFKKHFPPQVTLLIRLLRLLLPPQDDKLTVEIFSLRVVLFLIYLKKNGHIMATTSTNVMKFSEQCCMNIFTDCSLSCL